MKALHWLTPALLSGLVVAASTSGLGQDSEKTRVLSQLSPGVQIEGEAPLHWSVEERMREYGVPGLSIAVVRDGRIAWTYEAGVLEAGKPGAVTATTRFRAQSLAKPVTAFAALRLVDQDALALDEPLDRYLRSWTIPADPSVKGTPTLRQTLSHSGGFSVWGVPKYARGAELPTLLQALDGVPPAAPDPVRLVTSPGSQTRYSGGGYSVVQLLLEEQADRAFADIMRALVLEPAGMSASVFHTDVPANLERTTAVGHTAAGRPLEDRWPALVQIAAGGLLTTASDMARFIVTVTDAWHGRSPLLSQALAREMMTVQQDGWGLGLEIQGEGDELSFSHTGSGNGFRAIMAGVPAKGDGVVILSNADRGSELRYEILRSLARELNWQSYRPVHRSRAPLGLAEARSLAGSYVFGDGSTMLVAWRQDRLVASWRSQPAVEMIPAGSRVFFNRANEEYEFSADGRTLTWRGGFGSFVARRGGGD